MNDKGGKKVRPVRLERMIGILSILLQQERVTAPVLAEKFEVSRRTIERDIDALCMAGIPLVTTRGVNGGISIMEGYRIDRTLLTSDELRAILAGLRSLDSCAGTKRYAQLMEKLGASRLMPGDQHILIDLASWSRERLTPKLELLHTAIEQKQLVSFAYAGPGGESRREIEPYYLLFHWSSWYVWGWCSLREDFRLFKIGRMEGLTAGEGFVPREAPLPVLEENVVFPQTVQVRALIQPSRRWRLAEEFGPDCFQTRGDGLLEFYGGFSDREAVCRWVASFDGEAELIEPVELREEMVRFAEKLLRIHGKT